jgi:hypothetical protein
MKTKLHHLCILLALLALSTFNSQLSTAHAQGTTAFTYQGQLHDGGTNANGTYTMMFKLYDASTSGNQIGSTITTSPTLANGLFTVNLDFGAGAFNGSARWLDITVTSGATTQTLSPRVQVLADPYAQFAAVAATVTNGAIMNSQLAANAIATTNIQNGAITTTQIANGAVTNANLTANSVATANIQDASVTDAKIVSVSGSKVSGGVAFATNATFATTATTAGSATSAVILTNGIWDVSVGSYQSPGPLFTDSLLFSAQGVVQAMFSSSSGLFAVVGNITCNTDKPNAVQLNGSGSTITGDGGGGMLIYNPSGSGSVDISGGNVTASGTVYAGGVALTSDRNAKGNFTAVNSREVLDKVASLPVTEWNYKADSKDVQHIGPMAQDFHAAFGLDGNDDKHISVVDEGGVALAAIQGLNEKLKAEDTQKDAQIKALEKRLSDLEQLVKTSVQK